MKAPKCPCILHYSVLTATNVPFEVYITLYAFYIHTINIYIKDTKMVRKMK